MQRTLTWLSVRRRIPISRPLSFPIKVMVRSASTLTSLDFQRYLSMLEKESKESLRLCFYSFKKVEVELLRKGKYETLMEVPLEGDFPFKEVLNRIQEKRQLAEKLEQLPISKRAVFDLTSPPDPIPVAKQRIKSLYPRLILVVDHSSDGDALGSRTHAFHVFLRLKREEIAMAELSPSEEAVLTRFKGEAIGKGYHRTAEKALSEAFKAAGIHPPLEDELAVQSGRSIEHLFLREVQYLCPSVWATVDQAENKVSVTFHTTDSESPGSAEGDTVNLHQVLLEATKKALITLHPTRYTELSEEVEKNSISILLPEVNLNLKRILRVLMSYYYGTSKENIVFEHTRDTGVYHCTVSLTLPLQSLGLSEEDVRVEMEKVSGNSRRTVEQFAAVLAIKRLFPKEYKEQIEYHPEVSQLLYTADVSSDNTKLPPTTSGWKKLLEWVLQRQEKTYRLETFILQIGKEYRDLGVSANPTSWAAQLYITNKTTCKETLFCTTFDLKKAKAEQKAMSFAVVSLYPHSGEALADAKRLNLLNEEGKPVECSTVKPISLTTESTPTLHDPLVDSLLPETPHQSLTVNTEGVAPLLTALRAWAKERELVEKESIQYDELRDQFTIRLQSKDGNVQSTLIASNKIAGILSAYLRLPCDDERLCAHRKTVLECLEKQLPLDTPLTYLANTIYALYGVLPRITITGDSSVYANLYAEENPGGVKYFISQGRGVSVQEAVFAACKAAFVRHVVPHFSVFEEEMVLSIETLPLVPDSSSSLSELLRSVESDIQRGAQHKECRVVLHLSPSTTPSLFTVKMSAANGGKTIQLEKETGPTLPAALTGLCTLIASETGLKLNKPLENPDQPHTYLEALCRDTFGLPLVVEYHRVEKDWCTRLSLALNDDYRYGLCTATDKKKKSSYLLACQCVVNHYFSDSIEEGKNIKGVTLLNYIFAAPRSTEVRTAEE